MGWVSVPKIVVVTRETRLQGLKARFNTRAQAKFYLEQQNQDFELYADEQEVYSDSLDRLKADLQELGRPVHVIDRAYLPNYLFDDEDVVVTVGPDGLVVNAAKYLDGHPIVAVNPDPQHIDGILLPFLPTNAKSAVAKAIRGNALCYDITMAQVRLNDGQTLLAFNDFFIGQRGHASARYRLSFKGQAEEQTSSGVLVSTGAGSTGWVSSLQNQTRALGAFMNAQHGMPLPPTALPVRWDWQDPRLVFMVREPFVSRSSSMALSVGTIEPGDYLQIESRMADGGVIFSDGIESDVLAFNAGSLATVRTAEKTTRLVRDA